MLFQLFSKCYQAFCFSGVVIRVWMKMTEIKLKTNKQTSKTRIMIIILTIKIIVNIITIIMK